MSTENTTDSEQPAIPPLPPAAVSAAMAKYIWEVHTRIPKPEAEHTTIPSQMTVVAEHINQVWDYIAADRADERTEVVALIRREPVVAVLPPNETSSATAGPKTKPSSSQQRMVR